MKKLEMAKLVNYEETCISQMPQSMWKTFFFGTRYHFMAVVEQASWYWWTSGSLVKDMSPMLER